MSEARGVPAQARASISASLRARERISSGGICRTISCVAALITVIIVRPLVWSTRKCRSRAVLRAKRFNCSTARDTSTCVSATGKLPPPAGLSLPLACFARDVPEPATTVAAVLAGAAVRLVKSRTITITLAELQPPAVGEKGATSAAPNQLSLELTALWSLRSIERVVLPPTAAAPTPSAVPHWPEPKWLYRPAARSALASGPLFQPQNRRPECGYEKLKDSR